jgi:LAO/AO transport system kinase
MLNEPIDLTPALERHRARGGWRDLSKAITLIENETPWRVFIPPAQNPIHCIGVTGPPGVGKSTLVGRLIQALIQGGRRVGVVAVDPSSPLTGGAVLGDRIRMEKYLANGGSFVRSLASRGSSGALSVSVRRVVKLMEASGSFDMLLVETVGAGQGDVTIANLADTVVLVTIAGLGDAVQTFKAGVLEVAHIVVVNMADKPGASESSRLLRLSLGEEVGVVQTVATLGTGVPELIKTIDARWTVLAADGQLEIIRRRGDLAEATLLAEEMVRSSASQLSGNVTSIEATVGHILEEATRRWRR